MQHSDALVSIGLPVFNAGEDLEGVVKSVLEQDHENLELVICDNASTDNTEDVCRALAAQDRRIVYHRNATNVGLLNNFVGAMRLAKGTYFRWIGDDDWLDPRYVSRCLDAFAEDDRLILVTTQIEYTGPDGVTQTAPYNGTALRSDDPVTRLRELLRLLNEGHLMMDTCYGVFRRERVIHIKRRNMVNDDQVYSAKLALAGPWGHVSEVLARRNWTYVSKPDLARKLGVSRLQARFPNEAQCLETARYLSECDLDWQQRNRARMAVVRLYTRRRQNTVIRRSGRLVAAAQRLAGHGAHSQESSAAAAPAAVSVGAHSS
ncbi:MAG TPA: glycosyltransferase family 2 protein [Mycobacterium sp.]|jgi:glycosyltransferase involved in cell wall biosynthesis